MKRNISQQSRDILANPFYSITDMSACLRRKSGLFGQAIYFSGCGLEPYVRDRECDVGTARCVWLSVRPPLPSNPLPLPARDKGLGNGKHGTLRKLCPFIVFFLINKVQFCSTVFRSKYWYVEGELNILNWWRWNKSSK